MKNTDFCADRIDFITNFAVITNAVIKRVHCIAEAIHRIIIPKLSSLIYAEYMLYLFLCSG